MRHYLQNYWQQPRSGATLSRRSVNHWQKRLIRQHLRSAPKTLAKLSRNARQNSNQGFALPMALGMGLIMLLVGVTMILRSQDDQVTASAQKATDRGLSAAETGITRYQSFINNNRAIATYPNSGTPSWSNPSTISGIENPCTAASETTKVQNMASGWQDVDASDSSKGQYRLIEYTYTPGTGTLTVEGRVNQIGTGNTATDSVGTATSQLKVKFPVQKNPSSRGLPGLWLRNTANASGSVSIKANLQDSSCNASVSTELAKKDNRGNYKYLDPLPDGSLPTVILTPGLALPELPPEGQSPPSGAGVYTIGAISLSGSNSLALPNTGQTAENGVLQYVIESSGGNSIKLSGSSHVTVGGPGISKVVLYLKGNLDNSGGTSINVYPGAAATATTPAIPPTKLIIYAHGNVELSGGSSTNAIESSSPENAQIYVYGSNSVRMTGGSGMKTFLLAPESSITMSGGANIIGSILAKEWSGSGTVDLIQVNNQGIDPEQIEAKIPPNIGSISSWLREVAQ